MAEELKPAALYDELQRRFGIGSWDEGTSRIPYFKARMTEIGKLKRMLTSRRTKPEDVMLAAEYASAQRIPIRETWELFALIPDAKRARRQQAAPTDTAVALQAAVAEATEAGATDWAYRLYNADPRSGQALLKEWEAWKTARCESR